MFDSPHPPAFFEPLIDSEHAAALIQVHPKTLQRYARKGIVVGLRVGKLWRFRASELTTRRPEEYYEALDEDAQVQVLGHQSGDRRLAGPRRTGDDQ